ncbi:MAG: acetyl-CoA hydrolase [Gammaproteobacteria bacterium]|nr:acetyl-CoA hydrolase [Gammaproteobacteria bacterium]
MKPAPQEFHSVDDCVEAAIARVGKRIVLGAPIGIGKPNQLVNAFYRRVERDPSLELTIFTGLSLEKPRATSDLEQRFLGPFIERQFGDYEELEYMRAIRESRLPSNVRVHEFYFRAGSMKGVASAQRDYVSSNYTFAARDLIGRGMNVMVQLVASATVDGERKLSLSSNTDTSLDLLPWLDELRARGEPCMAIAQLHPDLPFMYNRAMIDPGCFDVLVSNPEYDRTLFAPPNLSVGVTDYAIGLHVSTLLRDGGTLQIGIGSLGDAIVHASKLRHEDNASYREVCRALGVNEALASCTGGLGPFERGLYGCSEMFVNGFMHLIAAGIVKRRVYDDERLQSAINRSGCAEVPDSALLRELCAAGAIGARLTDTDVAYLKRWGVFAADVEMRDSMLWRGERSCAARLDTGQALQELSALALGTVLRDGVHMHGGFFLGPKDFYETLRTMPRAQSELIAMDSVRRINRIDQPGLREAQRLHARFVNTGMMVTLGGAVVSDALESGEVVSGVGGQYNFVAQAHELPGARSVICLRATRGSGRATRSNIVPRYGHVTIPRHLRDIVVTEYGVADLRGLCDEEIIRALLNIADSRFQPELLAAAREAGKIDPDYRVPEAFRRNLPAKVQEALGSWRKNGYFPAFPLGTDFTAEEVALGGSLKDMKALMDSPANLLRAVIRSFITDVDEEQARPYLERIGLAHPDTPKEHLLQHLLLLELEERGVLRPM